MRTDGLNRLTSDVVAQRLYSMRPGKGYVDNDKSIYYHAWDFVEQCTREDCVAYASCPYDKHGKPPGQKEYMRSVQMVIFRNLNGNLSEMNLYRIGMHLLPLYRILMKLKIQEIGDTQAVTTDDKGMKRINPIYKEIRETIKQIEFIWKSLGFTDDVPKPKGIGDDLKGNPDYYQEIQEDANRRKRLVRRANPTS